MRIISILLFALLSGMAQAADRPVVIASTTQIADFARAVGGDHIEVHCILEPGADPHSYQVTTRDAERVLRADLCLQNGLHLEGANWMAKLADDAGKPVITCTDGVALLQIEEEGETVPDPHAWFDPANAAVYVRNITEALSELDPAHEEGFRARAELLRQQLRVLDAWIKQQVAAIPAERRVLVTSHDAFNYFCRSYGFTNRAPVGWSTAELEGGVTPQRRQKVVAKIRSEGIPAVFVETSVNDELLREIAKEAGVRIGGTLYSDSMGVEDSAGEHYIGMMRENVLTIVEALR